MIFRKHDLLTVCEQWKFSVDRYSQTIKEIGDVCAIRHKKGKSFRRDYERGLLMVAVVTHYGCHKFLEFGTGRGFVTACLSMLDEITEITTIDKLDAKDTVDIMRKSKYSNMSKVNFISRESKRLKDSEVDNDFDIVFIDGEHTREAVAHDFKFAINHTTKDAIIVFDDYRNKHRGVKKYINSLVYNKTLVYTDGWVYKNDFIKSHGDADKVVNNREVGSGQVILLKGVR